MTTKRFLFPLLMALFPPGICSAEVSGTKLADEIIFILKKYYSKSQVEKSSLYMARQAVVRATDYESLRDNLETVFLSDDADLKWLAGTTHTNFLKTRGREKSHCLNSQTKRRQKPQRMRYKKQPPLL